MKCPHCHEEIKDGALKCKYCKEFVDENREDKPASQPARG